MSYETLYIPGKTGMPLLVMFHGTGGDERQMLELAKAIAPDFGYLSLRGKVDENGALRYFRRFSERDLDLVDLAFRIEEIGDFLTEMKSTNLELPGHWVLGGYSNGANVANMLLQTYPHLAEEAICLRPMNPLQPDPAKDLSGKKFLLLGSNSDAVTPIEGFHSLKEWLRSCGATVVAEEVPGGHGLTQADVIASQKFLNLTQ